MIRCAPPNTHNFLYASAEVLAANTDSRTRYGRGAFRKFNISPPFPYNSHTPYVLGAAATRLFVQLGGDGASLPSPSLVLAMIAAAARRRRIPISTPLTVSPPPTHPTSLPQSSLLDQAARAWRRSVCPPSGEGSAGATTRAWLVVHLCSRPCIDEGFSSAPLQNLSWRNRGYIVASHGTVPQPQP